MQRNSVLKSRVMRISIIWVLVSISLFGLRAQGDDLRLASKQHDAVTTIAQYFAGRIDRADRALRLLGYEPTLPAAWKAFPPLRKVETAYFAAAAADPKEGGDRFLAVLAQSLAQRYDAVNDEKALASYLDKNVDADDLEFETPSAAAVAEKLPQPIRDAIATISDYYSSGGSVRQVLTSDLKLSPDEAYEILRSSGTIEEALTRGISRLPESNRGIAIGKIARKLSSRYEAASYEQSFAPFAPDLRPPSGDGPSTGPNSAAPSPGSPSPIGPTFGGPSANPEEPYSRSTPPPRSGSEPARVYRDFVHTEYGGGGAGGFAEVVTVIEGFGGVVFGNSVTSPLPPPTSVSFSASGKSLTIAFGPDSSATYGPITADAASTAAQIVESSRVPWQPGKAIGLTSLILKEGVEYRTCKPRESHPAWNIALHPALVDSDVGWSTIMSDVIPIHAKPLVRAVGSAAGKDAEATVGDVLAEFERYDSLGNWKIVDVPMVIERDGSSLRVRRSDADGIPDAVARSAYFTMNAFFGDDEKAEVDADFAHDFYMIVPTLTRTFYDYKTLNDFAAVLAIYRWAKAQHAIITPVATTGGRRARTPEAITFNSQDLPIPLRRIPRSAIEAHVWDLCKPQSAAHKPSR